MIRFLYMLTAVGFIFSIAAKAPAQDQKKTADPFARWESNIKAFEADDKKHPKEPGQVLFIGSSSIRLWDLEKWFPGLDAINRGFGGSEVADSLHFYDRIVKPYAPRAIVMYAGDNDLSREKTPAQVQADFKEFVTKVHKDFPDTQIIFVAIKPSIKRWNLIEKVREANSLIIKMAESDEQLTFLDIDTPMIGEDEMPKKEFFAKDGLHLNDAGYKLWSDLLKPHLDAIPAIKDARFKPLRNLRDAYHPWSPPTTLAAWEKEAERIRRQVLVSNGLWPLPEKTPLEPVISKKIDRGDHTVQNVYFRSRPGHYVTGNLYRPKNIEGKIPGILCPHGHWKDGRFYDAEGGSQSQLDQGAEEFASGAHSPLQARMVQLARMGTVVFHYDMIGYADSQPLDHRTGFNDADAALRLHNLMGLQTWNSIRSLDFLESLPEVDTDRLAVTGASGGGTQTMILAAIDDRVDVTFPAVMVSTGMQGGCVCENASYLRQGVNNIAFAALFAPKPQSMSGADDWTIEIETKGLPELKQVYSLFGKADNIEAKAFPQFKHNYNQVARELMYNWFNEHLDLRIDGPIQQSDFWPLTREQLTVFNDKNPLPDDALAAAPLRDLMTKEDQEEFESWLKGDIADYRNIVGGAAEVMLKPEVSDIETEYTTVRQDSEATSDITRADGIVTNSDGAHIKTVSLSSETKEPAGFVFWFDSAGNSHLFKDDGAIKDEVLQLIQAGYIVVSADLFMTGDSKGRTQSALDYPIDEKYPGYTYCYNTPLLTERVRDILTVIQNSSQQDKKRFLVATGDAGVWQLLARTAIPGDKIDQTIVDLNGFSFANVTTIDDPNLLPGALKFGGLPGLARLIEPSPLAIFGASKKDDFNKTLSHFKENLILSSEPLTDKKVVQMILESE
ncbi:GDSL-type esterase/lipase family protein [Thalassoglobus polymorphus]|uniref:GDSL-like Lipase/Acylhydrolase n=1 Tax=Thalassoglobus polymorphus TaxID=2527994 RepID=A0A517QIJ1_9PLAN|nr:GDSL-type esterase/lipase family protein [Thalassoglobus polymorphus]QDT31387.1 GDSL-like Lipase/Acylhydrolase [Thalassoglobus polymorphus]